MSQKCSCGQPSKGSIGMLRYCYVCFAALCNWRHNDPRLKQRVTVELTDDGRRVGWAEWVPDAAISVERSRKKGIAQDRALATPAPTKEP